MSLGRCRPAGFRPPSPLCQDGGTVYLSGKGDTENGGLAGVLPALTAEQRAFLTAAAVDNLPDRPLPLPAIPAAVKHVVMVLGDARGAAWQDLKKRFTHLAGVVVGRP